MSLFKKNTPNSMTSEIQNSRNKIVFYKPINTKIISND